jgi:hypothetical protein
MSDEMIQIYGYNTFSRASTGAVRMISIYAGIPEGWTSEAPPTDVPEGGIPHYFGPYWVISDPIGHERFDPVAIPQTEPQVI